MVDSVASLFIQPRSRLIYMLALADSYTILYLTGPELGTPRMGVMWSPEVMGGFYGQYLSSAADRILDASPELNELLSSDDWTDTVLVPYCAHIQDQMNQQITPEQLAELRTNLNGAMLGFTDQLKEIQGDGQSPLGDSLQVDVDTVAQEPSRLRQVFSPKNLVPRQPETDG